MIGRIGPRSVSDAPDGREDTPVVPPQAPVEPPQAPVEGAPVVVPFVGCTVRSLDNRDRSVNKRKRPARAVGRDNAPVEGSTLGLVPSDRPDRSRMERSQYTVLMRTGFKSQIYGLKSTQGLPTIHRKKRKLLQASPSPPEADLGAKRTLSALSDRCQGLLSKEGRVEARQRAAVEQAGPVPASNATVSIEDAGHHLLPAHGTNTAGDGRLEAAARQPATGDEPAHAAGGTEEDRATTGGQLVVQVTSLTPYNGSNSGTSPHDNLSRPHRTDKGPVAATDTQSNHPPPLYPHGAPSHET